MTPKEKAEELFETFALGGWPEVHALSAVNEVLEAIQYLEPNIVLVSLSEYWLEVRDEIKKL